MTDIWRSLVAQRVLHAQGMGMLFHGPTVWQERNDHDLHRDFTEEVPGYTHNDSIREALTAIPFAQGVATRLIMETCYQTLIRHGWVGAGEEPLLQVWFDDLETLGLT